MKIFSQEKKLDEAFLREEMLYASKKKLKIKSAVSITKSIEKKICCNITNSIKDKR